MDGELRIQSWEVESGADLVLRSALGLAVALNFFGINSLSANGKVVITFLQGHYWLFSLCDCNSLIYQRSQDT